MHDFEIKRLGLLMEAEPGNPQEVGGVLNPAAARGPDGKLYLFPRVVGEGNYSRIGIARVRFNTNGDPCGVDRLGIALEPEADYELQGDGRGGCEDARITYIERFGRYIMTYTALSAMIHRPLFIGSRPEETDCDECSRMVDVEHESIWISYCPMELDGLEPTHLGSFNSHHRLATPVEPWESLKIGGGTPPVMARHGWMILYHGVHATDDAEGTKKHLFYSAGVMILSKEHPRTILYRSAQPLLTPLLPHERDGIVENVVFPTGIDCRSDIGQPDRFDIYYGMADSRIGVASGRSAADRNRSVIAAKCPSRARHSANTNTRPGSWHDRRRYRRTIRSSGWTRLVVADVRCVWQYD